MAVAQKIAQDLPLPEALVALFPRLYSRGALEVVAGFVKSLQIQEGHLEISRAWKVHMHNMGYQETAFGVVGALLQKKQDAEKRACDEQQRRDGELLE